MTAPEEDSKLMTTPRRIKGKAQIELWGYEYEMGFSLDRAEPGVDDVSYADVLSLKDRTLAWNTGRSRAIRESKKMLDNVKKIDTTNPKDLIGAAKAPLSTIPAGVMFELGLAMFEGSLKYGRHNYRETPVRASIYYDAFMRHVQAWWEGEDNDPAINVSHLIKAMACLTIIRDCEMRGTIIDDRPPALPEGWLEELNEKAKVLAEKYPDPVPAFTRLDAGSTND